MQENMEIDVKEYKIGVVGAGSWGTALAHLIANKGFHVNHWAFEQEVVDQIQNHRENQFFLPGFTLSDNITASNDLQSIVSDKDLVLVVVPSHVIRETTQKMVGHLSEKTIVVSASKGIENKTHLTMSGVIKENSSATAGSTIGCPIRAQLCQRSGPAVADGGDGSFNRSGNRRIGAAYFCNSVFPGLFRR